MEVPSPLPSLLTSPSFPPPSPLHHLISGSIAGLSVDLLLYPLDTLKTRLQSPKGFFGSGGFKGIYNGIPSVLLGSAPTAAAFFVTYEYSKQKSYDRIVKHYYGNHHHPMSPSSSSPPLPLPSSLLLPLSHAASSSVAEVISCILRVPMDNVKQRSQAGYSQSTRESAIFIWNSHPKSIFHRIFSFYNGFHSTIIRDIPFAFIQFPLYEYLKSTIEKYKIIQINIHRNNHTPSLSSTPLSPFDYALIGSLSGSIAAFITTPLDVIKTRIMLGTTGGVLRVGRSVYSEGGMRKLFLGVGPRVMWVGMGGAIFFGAYENTIQAVRKVIK